MPGGGDVISDHVCAGQVRDLSAQLRERLITAKLRFNESGAGTDAIDDGCEVGSRFGLEKVLVNVPGRSRFFEHLKGVGHQASAAKMLTVSGGVHERKTDF